MRRTCEDFDLVQYLSLDFKDLNLEVVGYRGAKDDFDLLQHLGFSSLESATFLGGGRPLWRLSGPMSYEATPSGCLQPDA